jgi:hypothetical protein
MYVAGVAIYMPKADQCSLTQGARTHPGLDAYNFDTSRGAGILQTEASLCVSSKEV